MTRIRLGKNGLPHRDANAVSVTERLKNCMGHRFQSAETHPAPNFSIASTPFKVYRCQKKRSGCSQFNFELTATCFRVLKRVANPFQSARTTRTLISECANESHLNFRVRKRVAHPFQSARTSRTLISECANEPHINFRVRKRVAHPFQSARTSRTSISEC